jgi:Arc/MetJ-type ribon-helix-helix transcriptional regulator
MTQIANEPSASDVVRHRVRQLRERRGWSAHRLAERCRELGLDELTRDVITSVEVGRRKAVTVDQLLGLALALDVSPVHLLVEDAGAPRTVGKVTVASPLAWVAGLRPEPSDTEVWSTTHPDPFIPAAFALVRRRLADVLRDEMDELLGAELAREVYGPPAGEQSTTTTARKRTTKEGASSGKRQAKA